MPLLRDSTPLPTTCAAVFDNKVAAEDFVKRIKEEDLGLSINISTSIDCAVAAPPPAMPGFHGTAWGIRWASKARPRSCRMLR